MKLKRFKTFNESISNIDSTMKLLTKGFKWSRKPVNWEDIDKMKVVPLQQSLINELEVFELNQPIDYVDINDCQFYLVKHNNKLYLADSQGYDYPKYLLPIKIVS